MNHYRQQSLRRDFVHGDAYAFFFLLKYLHDYEWNPYNHDDRPCGITFEEAEKESWDVMTGGMCGDYPGELEEDIYYDSLGH